MITFNMSDNYQQRNTTKNQACISLRTYIPFVDMMKTHIPIPDGNEWKEPCLRAKIF